MSGPSDTQELASVRTAALQKLTRARQLTEQIAHLGDAYLQTEPIILNRREVEDDTEIRVVDIQPAPPLLGLMFGEVLAHLRSCLDQTVLALVELRNGGPLSDEHEVAVSFPIATTEAAFRKWLNRVSKVPMLREGELVDRIHVLQPAFHAEYDHVLNPDTPWGRWEQHYVPDDPEFSDLATLNRLCNHDKHRRTMMTVAMPDMIGAEARSTVLTDGNFADLLQPLVRGALIARCLTGATWRMHLSMGVQDPLTKVHRDAKQLLDGIHGHLAGSILPYLIEGKTYGAFDYEASQDLLEPGRRVR